MLAVAQGQKNGTVLVWDAASKPVARAGLGGFADPLAIDRLGDAAVAADFEGVALYRIGAQGQYLGSFGDEGFQRELRSSREQIAACLAVGQGRLGRALRSTLAIGFLLAWRYSEKPGQQAAVQAFAGLSTGIGRGAARDGGIETAGLVRQTGCHCRCRWNAAGAGGAGRSVCPLSLMNCRLRSAARRCWCWAWCRWCGWPWLWRCGRRWAWRSAASCWPGVSRRCAARDRTLASVPVLQVVASPQALLIGRVVLPYRGVNAAGPARALDLRRRTGSRATCWRICRRGSAWRIRTWRAP